MPKEMVDHGWSWATMLYDMDNCTGAAKGGNQIVCSSGYPFFTLPWVLDGCLFLSEMHHCSFSCNLRA